MSVKLRGVREMRRKLAEQTKRVEKALGGALFQEGTAIISESQKIVPHEFGVLERSAYVAPPQKKVQQVTVEIGYGTEYALRQHEELSWQHRGGRQAKYLEQPLSKASSGWQQRIGKRIAALLKSGVGFGG